MDRRIWLMLMYLIAEVCPPYLIGLSALFCFKQVVMLVLAWKLDAQNMGYFTLQEWLKGMTSLQ